MPQAKFSAAARRDLNGIFDFGVEHFGLAAADDYAALLTALAARTADAPMVGTAVANRGSLRRVSTGSHIIYYRPIDIGVYVVRVLHMRMDAGRHLPTE